MKYFNKLILSVMLIPFLACSANEESLMDVVRGYSVISSPDIGVERSYSGTDLVAMAEQHNIDLTLIEQAKDLKVKQGKSPLLDLGGLVGFLGISSDDNYDGSSSYNLGKDFNLDITAIITNSIRAFSKIVLDDNGMIVSKHAFIAFGNLEYSPFYLTLGKLDVLGGYDGNSLTQNLSKTLVNTNKEAIRLGYFLEKHDIKINGFVAPSTIDKQDFVAGGSASAKITLGLKSSLTLQAGIISNVFEVDSIQSILAKDAVKNIKNNFSQQIMGVHASVAVEINEKTNISFFIAQSNKMKDNQFTFKAPKDESASAAKPVVMDINVTQSFEAFSKDFSLTLCHSISKEAYFLNIPKNKTSITLTANLFKSSIAGIEISYDKSYKKDTVTNSELAYNSNALGKERWQGIFFLGFFF